MDDELGEPFSGFAFSGSREALARFAEAAAAEGFTLEPEDIGDEAALRLGATHTFEEAMALVQRVQSGEFGAITLGLMLG